MMLRMDALQRSFRCCGVNSILDWNGLEVMDDTLLAKSAQPTPAATNASHGGEEEEEEFNPYKEEHLFIPSSCIDTLKARLISNRMRTELQDSLSGYPLKDVLKKAPVFDRGCAPVLIAYLQEHLPTTLNITCNTTLLLLIWLTPCTFLVGRSETRRSKLPSENIKADYVSNAKLLNAIQGTALFAQPAKLQMAFGSLRGDWLWRDMKVGWILGGKHRQHCEYLRRIYKRRSEYPGQIKKSAFRRFLRSYLPLLEAIIYADGDVRREIEGNDYYGGYLATACRVIVFALYGYLCALILLATFPTDRGEISGASQLESSQALYARTLNEAKTADALIRISGVYVHFVFIVAAVISRRFRCFLAMLIPTLGLTTGQSFLAAELTHLTVAGPFRGIMSNLRAAGGTLTCLMELSGNITRDATRLLKPGMKPITDEETPGALTGSEEEEGKKRKSPSATGKNTTEEKLTGPGANYEHEALTAGHSENATTKYFNLTGPLEKELTSDDEKGKKVDQPKPPEFDHNEAASSNAAVEKQFEEENEKMTISAKENFKRKQKEVSNRLQAIFKNVDASASKKATVQKAVDFGAKIEDSIRRRLTNTCMILHRTRTQQCNLVAIESCYQIQKLASIAARFPILIAGWCSREVLKGTACPTQAALKKAIDECSRSGYNIGLRDGVGAQFAMAKTNLQDVGKAFKVKIGYERVKTAASSAKARMHDSATAVEKLAYLTMDATRVLFAFVMAVSTLLRLVFVLLLIKAQTYISKYLLDMDFDNVYVEDVYEDIDARRRKEGRMYLLPLKAHERKVFFWRRKSYTPAEFLRAVVTFMKYIALGIALTMVFAVDAYLYNMMVILDEASKAELRLGAKARDTDSNAAAVKILGEGFLAEALNGIVTSFKMLMDVDLQYHLSQCAPNMVTSSPNMRQYFLSVWALLLLLALISGYLLRMRHHILGFFYPPAHRRRQVHLYNTMLVNRQRDLTTNRNMVIHHVSMGRLQALGQLTGKVSGFAELAPGVAAAAGLVRATCILCHDRLAVKPDVMYLCPVDGCAICRQCQLRISNDHDFCIACVNRNEEDMDQALLQLVSQTRETVWSGRKKTRKQPETSQTKETL
ncbi:hypothetical protein AAHC03_027145 [Spirometra sp. Aus1]